MVIGLITARANSLRLPGKNLLKIGGMTLIERTIKEAYDSGIFDAVILTTDIPRRKIRINSDQFDLIFDERPADLCRSGTASEKVVKYIIEKYGLKKSDEIILLQPTSPLRKSGHIRKAYRLMKRSSKPVHSVTETKGDASWYFIGSGNMAKPAVKNGDGKKLLVLNGAVYAFKAGQFLKNNKIPFDSFVPLIMSMEESVDIDTEADYLHAKRMLISKKAKQEEK